MQQTPTRRTPRACERCRRMRKRCEPPYPCRHCVVSKSACDVRAEARPLRQRRRQQHQRPSLEMSPTSSEKSGGVNSPGGKAQAPSASLASETPRSEERHLRQDTYHLLYGLVQSLALERYGYNFSCELVEPTTGRPMASGSTFPPMAHANSQTHLSLRAAQIQHLLEDFNQFMGWQKSQLVDVRSLQAIADIHLKDLSDLTPAGVCAVVTQNRSPVDSIALIFAALALGAVGTSDLNNANFFYTVSTELVKHFVQQPTLHLCLAYFLQHHYALRSGTSNYAQGIMAQAIHVAHAIGLHENSHGPDGLQLFLMIFMADQYGSLQHNTEPIIRASNLSVETFAPLSERDPQFRTIVGLIMINGNIVEQSHRPSTLTEPEIQKLEKMIGDVCSRQDVPMSATCGTYWTKCEMIARIHMYCCRINVRAPGLSANASWLSSVCICVHAAQGMLATYLELYRPVLIKLAEQCDEQDARVKLLSNPITSPLAVTWRHVRRIMSAVYIVIYAYLHGELPHSECSRYLAISRLLLEYPRWRWGEELDEAIQMLTKFSSLADLSFETHIRELLPRRYEQYLRTICGHAVSTAEEDEVLNASGLCGDGLFMGTSWPVAADFGAIADEAFAGLWESTDDTILNELQMSVDAELW